MNVPSSTSTTVGASVTQTTLLSAKKPAGLGTGLAAAGGGLKLNIGGSTSNGLLLYI